MRRPLLLALVCLLPACGGDAVDAPSTASRSAAGDPASADPLGGGAASEAGEATPEGTSSTAAESRLRAARDATIGAGAARTTFVGTLTGLPGRSAPVVLTGAGAVDFDTGRMRSSLDVSGALGRPAAAPTDTTWETIAADGVVYLRSAMMSDLLGFKTPWLRIDPSSELLASGGVPPLAQLAGSEGGGPLALLAGLQPGSVADLGPSDVGGTATTHLRATVDLLAAVDEATDVPEAEALALERFVEGLGAQTLTVDAYLDGDGRVRRLVYEHELAPGTGGGSQRVEVGYDELGAPVDITVPPEDQISFCGRWRGRDASVKMGWSEPVTPSFSWS